MQSLHSKYFFSSHFFPFSNKLSKQPFQTKQQLNWTIIMLYILILLPAIFFFKHEIPWLQSLLHHVNSSLK